MQFALFNNCFKLFDMKWYHAFHLLQGSSTITSDECFKIEISCTFQWNFSSFESFFCSTQVYLSYYDCCLSLH